MRPLMWLDQCRCINSNWFHRRCFSCQQHLLPWELWWSGCRVSNKQNILVIIPIVTPVLLKIARHGACKDFAFLIFLTWSVWRIRGSRKGIEELRHRIPTIRLVPHRGEWSRSADTISWLSPFLPVSPILRIPWDSSALEPLSKCPLFSAWYSWHVIYVYAGSKTLGSMCCFIWLSSLSSILGRKLNFRIPQSPIFNILSFSPFQFLVAASAHTFFFRKGLCTAASRPIVMKESTHARRMWKGAEASNPAQCRMTRKWNYHQMCFPGLGFLA